MKKSKPKRQENGYPSIEWLRDTYIYDTETGSVLYKETYGTRGRRHKRSLTVVGWIKRDKKTGNGKLFEFKQYDFFCYVTTGELTCLQIHNF